MIEQILEENGIKVGSEEFNALGDEYKSKFQRLESLVKNNQNGLNNSKIAALELELKALFSMRFETIDKQYEKQVMNYLKKFAKDKKEAAREIVLYVKFHKSEKECELHIHMMKWGNNLHTNILKSKDIEKAVMTKLERLFTTVAKENDSPVSLITYEIGLKPFDQNALAIRPCIKGNYKTEVTINDLIKIIS